MFKSKRMRSKQPKEIARAQVLQQINATIQGMSSGSEPTVLLDHDIVVQTAISCSMRKRHLASVSLHAIILAEALHKKKNVLTSSSARSIDFVREIGGVLSKPVTTRQVDDAFSLPMMGSADYAEDDGNIIVGGAASPTMSGSPTQRQASTPPLAALLLSWTHCRTTLVETSSLPCAVSLGMVLIKTLRSTSTAVRCTASCGAWPLSASA